MSCNVYNKSNEVVDSQRHVKRKDVEDWWFDVNIDQINVIICYKG